MVAVPTRQNALPAATTPCLVGQTHQLLIGRFVVFSFHLTCFRNLLNKSVDWSNGIPTEDGLTGSTVTIVFEKFIPARAKVKPLSSLL
jgi:hypothetical protein